MDDAIDLPTFLFDDKTLQMMEQMRRIQEEQQKPIETYRELVGEVTLTVAIGLNGFDAGMGDVREMATKRYHHEPMFYHQVSAITAELMRIIGRYERRADARR